MIVFVYQVIFFADSVTYDVYVFFAPKASARTWTTLYLPAGRTFPLDVRPFQEYAYGPLARASEADLTTGSFPDTTR